MCVSTYYSVRLIINSTLIRTKDVLRTWFSSSLQHNFRKLTSNFLHAHTRLNSTGDQNRLWGCHNPLEKSLQYSPISAIESDRICGVRVLSKLMIHQNFNVSKQRCSNILEVYMSSAKKSQEGDSSYLKLIEH